MSKPEFIRELEKKGYVLEGNKFVKKKSKPQEKPKIKTCPLSGKIVEVEINPVPKPRMVKSDAYKKRKVVQDYWAYKDQLKFKCSCLGVNDLPDVVGISFVMPMPRSWTKKKKSEMDGKPHQQRPDLDNLIKGS